jgi:hypothetical protein
MAETRRVTTISLHPDIDNKMKRICKAKGDISISAFASSAVREKTLRESYLFAKDILENLSKAELEILKEEIKKGSF